MLSESTCILTHKIVVVILLLLSLETKTLIFVFLLASLEK